MKKSVIIAICLGIFVSVSVVFTLNNTEETISDGVIRLHVVAHDDTRKEQKLKLKVRDRILQEGRRIYGEENKRENVKGLTLANLTRFEKVALDEIRKNGYDHAVEVTFGKSDFPAKVYKDICLPAGSYEALVVKIGSAGGHNWWCVMFPPLCFVNESCERITSESKNIMIDNIGKDGFELISTGKPKIKFKVYEWWKKITK